MRWWNVKHPSDVRRAARRRAPSPAAGRETLTAEQRHDEEVLLGVRLREGLPVDVLDAAGRTAVAGLVADGLVDGRPRWVTARVVLTLRGRLLADTVSAACSGSEQDGGRGSARSAHLTNWGVIGGFHHSPLLASTAPMMCTISRRSRPPTMITGSR